MRNFSLDNLKPEFNAHLAINKSLLKENVHNGVRTVYMKDKTEYQIELFNPEQATIGVEISLDGNSLENMIVIQPGQRVWLERYISEARKFLFEIYEVEANNKIVDDAISKNGNIEIKFYHEVKNNPVQINNYDWNQPLYNKMEFKNYNLGPSCCYTSYTSAASTYDYKLSAATTYEPTTSTTKLNSINPKYKETGRTGMGSCSSQQFSSCNKTFNPFPFHTENIKILPLSQKPYYKEDIERRYCTECGTRLKPKFKFCPHCGTKC